MTTTEPRQPYPIEDDYQPGELPSSHEITNRVISRLEVFCSNDYEATLAEMGIADTPLQPAPSLSGQHVYEMDLTGHAQANSYKLFGVVVKTLLGAQRARDKGEAEITKLVGASAGNHGEAIAAVAKMLGYSAQVMTAEDASLTKLARMEALKANVDNSYTELSHAQRAAADVAKEDGSLLIPPYDNYDVLAGQAIIGMRTVAELLRNGITGNVIGCLPIGGGGFAAGQIIGSQFALARAAAAGQDTSSFNLSFVGVQMEGGDPARRAVEAYRQNLPWGTLADLFSNEGYDKTNDGTFALPGIRTLPVLADKNLLSEIRTVSKGRVGLAMSRLLSQHGKTYEPAGSLSSALAKELAKEASEKTTFLTFLTGANVDTTRFNEYLQAGEGQRRADMLAASQALGTFPAPGSRSGMVPRVPKTGSYVKDTYRPSALLGTQVGASPLMKWGRR